MNQGWFRDHEDKIILVFRIVLGVIFLWASYDKIIDPGSFARAVANYKFLPEAWVNLFTILVPWLEFGCALLLLSGQWTRTASVLIGLLLVAFMIAVSVGLARGLDVHCGCFGSDSGRQIGLKLLGQDVLFLAMATFLAVRSDDRLGWAAFLMSRDV